VSPMITVLCLDHAAHSGASMSWCGRLESNHVHVGEFTFPGLGGFVVCDSTERGTGVQPDEIARCGAVLPLTRIPHRGCRPPG
jgi:hypothetical protein